MSSIVQSKKYAVAILAVALVGFGCSKKSSTPPEKAADGSTTSADFLEGATVTVKSSAGTPIANARVMIGLRENVPFPGNVLTMNASGQVSTPAEKWNDPQPVTIDAPGFIRATYFNV